ncbi:MAG: hypothetical protein AAB420_01505 [Patescibacteria group bacterium]
MKENEFKPKAKSLADLEEAVARRNLRLASDFETPIDKLNKELAAAQKIVAEKRDALDAVNERLSLMQLNPNQAARDRALKKELNDEIIHLTARIQELAREKEHLEKQLPR